MVKLTQVDGTWTVEVNGIVMAQDVENIDVEFENGFETDTDEIRDMLAEHVIGKFFGK